MNNERLKFKINTRLTVSCVTTTPPPSVRRTRSGSAALTPPEEHEGHHRKLIRQRAVVNDGPPRTAGPQPPAARLHCVAPAKGLTRGQADLQGLAHAAKGVCKKKNKTPKQTNPAEPLEVCVRCIHPRHVSQAPPKLCESPNARLPREISAPKGEYKLDLTIWPQPLVNFS